jgi:hypothetical protein
MRRGLVIGLATAALALAFLLSSAVTSSSRVAAVQGEHGQARVSSITRNAVLESIRARTAEVKRVDRIEAKLTTWGDLLRVHSPSLLVRGRDPARTLWVVAVGGAVQPVGARGRVFDWAIYGFDATTGDVVFSNANSNGPWPAYFDKLLDKAP